MVSTDLSTPPNKFIEPTVAKRQWLKTTFQPHASLTDDLSRRRSQLLAGMIFVTLVTGIIGLIYTVIRYPSSIGDVDTWFIGVSIGIVFVAMLVNRAGQIKRAAQIFITVMVLAFTFVPFIEGADRNMLFFAIIPVLVTSIFFNLRTTTLLAVGSTAIITILTLLTQSSRASSMMPTFFMTIAGGVIYLFINHLQFQEGLKARELEEVNQRLRESEVSLERRVRERTRDLQVASDVSLQITTQLDPTQLLADVVEQTANAFGLYHVSIFLYEEREHVLRLKQGFGTVGVEMVSMGKQFTLNDRGLVPTAAHTKQPALSNDVTLDKEYFANPLLPETRSELAVPMTYGGKLVGILDIQSEQANRFGDEDIRIMRTLAEQIAIAIKNSQLFEETKTAKEAAEKADLVKSAFLASMSHELRTPLNAIINFSKFLKKGIPGPVNGEQEELIGSIADSGQHLLNLINDVLDMSKIEAGSLRLYVESGIDLKQIVETAIQYTSPLIAEKSVEMHQDIPDQLPKLTGDRKRLLQIFLNILSNACKFTDDGSVSIRVQNKTTNLLVSVTDTGSGIAPEDALHVFRAGAQTDSGLRQGGNGTGLGMPICQKLVEAHEGRIWFDSQKDVGTTFYVELPLNTKLEPERNKSQ